MTRYTFICEHFNYKDFNGDENNVASKHTTQFRADALETMLENFEMFLRGSGFHFDGVLDIVPHERDCDIALDIHDDLEYETNPNQMSLFGSNDSCSVCGISKDIMMNHNCYDKNCTKGTW